MKWYQMDVEAIFRKLEIGQRSHGGGSGGANPKIRSQQTGRGGPNQPLKLLLHQFTSPLIYILMLAAVVTFFLQEYKDTGVIWR